MVENLYQKVEAILNNESRYWDCASALTEEVTDQLGETVDRGDEHLIESQVSRWWEKQNFTPDPDDY